MAVKCFNQSAHLSSLIPDFDVKNSGRLVRTLGRSVLFTSMRSTEAERSLAGSLLPVTLFGSRFLLTLMVLVGSVSMIPAEYKCFRFLRFSLRICLSEKPDK